VLTPESEVAHEQEYNLVSQLLVSKRVAKLLAYNVHVEVHWMAQSGEKSQVVVKEWHLDVAQKQISDV